MEFTFDYSALEVEIAPHPEGGILRFWQGQDFDHPEEGAPKHSFLLSIDSLRVLRDEISGYLNDSQHRL